MASDDDPTQTQQGKSSPCTKMKDGTTHLAYKAEHAVDLDINVVIAAAIHSGDASDGETIKETVIDAQVYLQEATGQGDVIEGIAVDKGYNKTQTLVWAEERGLRTYIPEPEHPHGRRWPDKPATWRAACYGTRRRSARQKGKALQRTRSELVERTLANVCGTGRARRPWIRGVVEIGKRYLMQVAAHNLGITVRKVFGVGTRRGLQGTSGTLHGYLAAIFVLETRFWPANGDSSGFGRRDLHFLSAAACCLRQHDLGSYSAGRHLLQQAVKPSAAPASGRRAQRASRYERSRW